MKTVNKFASQRKQWIDSIRLSPLGGLLSLTVHADEMWGRNVGFAVFGTVSLDSVPSMIIDGIPRR